jgi:hypothetical protein
MNVLVLTKMLLNVAIKRKTGFFATRYHMTRNLVLGTDP